MPMPYLVELDSGMLALAPDVRAAVNTEPCSYTEEGDQALIKLVAFLYEHAESFGARKLAREAGERYEALCDREALSKRRCL